MKTWSVKINSGEEAIAKIGFTEATRVLMNSNQTHETIAKMISQEAYLNFIKRIPILKGGRNE